MNTDHLTGLPAGFDPSSRVWIYQGHRPFTVEEARQIRALLESFIQSWVSHGTPVKGFAGIAYDQFVILMADETASGVSGCSTDSSVHLIKQIEQQTDVRLFDRVNLAFYVDGQVRLIPMTRLPEALNSGEITPHTLYFNNTIQTKEEFESKWLIPLKNSWLGAKFGLADGVGAK
jgi:hypothetical protein